MSTSTAATATRRRSLPGWATTLVIYLTSRAVSSALLAAVFLLATANGWHFASYRHDPDFFTFSSSWDSSAYRSVGEHGYPRTLPTDAAGDVAPNAWAFLPLYPALVSALAAVSGLDFYVIGVLVSAIFGAGAAVVLFRLLASRIGDRGAHWAVALFGFGPLGFLLQTSYAESMFLFLLFAALLAMMRRHYLLVGVFGVLAAFTRPGALAIPVALAVVFVLRLRDRRDAFGWAQRMAMVASAALVTIAGLAWPAIAASVTGRHDAYLQSELAFWAPLVGRQQFVPLTPWFLLATRYLGVGGAVLVVVILAAAVWWLARRRLRVLGPEVIGFSAGYALYLFAVFLPQQSLLRLLLPLSPLLGDPALRPGRRGVRVAVLAGCVALQAAAIVILWFLSFP